MMLIKNNILALIIFIIGVVIMTGCAQKEQFGEAISEQEITKIKDYKILQKKKKSNRGIGKEEPMKTLKIKWQRLVDENGQTCERCKGTEKELQKAFQSLKKSLAPLGIKVALEKKELDPVTCAKDVSQSNRIWVGERTLEKWLDASGGKSPCGFCCEELGEDVECRTIVVKGKTYEAVPAKLIIKAGLIAASRISEVSTGESCCE